MNWYCGSCDTEFTASGPCATCPNCGRHLMANHLPYGYWPEDPSKGFVAACPHGAYD